MAERIVGGKRLRVVDEGNVLHVCCGCCQCTNMYKLDSQTHCWLAHVFCLCQVPTIDDGLQWITMRWICFYRIAFASIRHKQGQHICVYVTQADSGDGGRRERSGHRSHTTRLAQHATRLLSRREVELQPKARSTARHADGDDELEVPVEALFTSCSRCCIVMFLHVQYIVAGLLLAGLIQIQVVHQVMYSQCFWFMSVSSH